MSEKQYIISEERLIDLLKQETELCTLESDGVDNWGGYGEGFDEVQDEDGEFDYDLSSFKLNSLGGE